MPTSDRELYHRCPVCHLVARYASADLPIVSATDRSIDWSRPVELSCGICYALTEVAWDQVLEHDAEAECSRCHTLVSCPAEASMVQCTNCGLGFYGPAADTPAKEQEVQIQMGLTNVALREKYRRATGRSNE
jgi:hypothetical protein